MEKKEALLIINPVSGTRSKSGLSQLVSQYLGKRGIGVTAVETKGGGDAFNLAKEGAESGISTIISAGGDGTVNEIANALAHTDSTLGIIPLGSGNGLARSLGIPQDTMEALKIIGEGHTLVSDRGLMNSTPFYCTSGIGFDAAVSEKFAGMKRRGRITYIRSVFREFLSYRSQPYAITIDGKVITERAFLIAICNAPQYGNNAYIAPQAKLTDGFLDITVVHMGSPLTTIFMGVDLMTGYLDRNTMIESFKVRGAQITRLSDAPVHVDGEPIIMGKHLDIKCDRKALRVYVPEKEAQFRPIVSPLRAMLDDMRYDVMAKFREKGKIKP